MVQVKSVEIGPNAVGIEIGENSGMRAGKNILADNNVGVPCLESQVRGFLKGGDFGPDVSSENWGVGFVPRFKRGHLTAPAARHLLHEPVGIAQVSRVALGSLASPRRGIMMDLQHPQTNSGLRKD